MELYLSGRRRCLVSALAFLFLPGLAARGDLVVTFSETGFTTQTFHSSSQTFSPSITTFGDFNIAGVTINSNSNNPGTQASLTATGTVTTTSTTSTHTLTIFVSDDRYAAPVGPSHNLSSSASANFLATGTPDRQIVQAYIDTVQLGQANSDAPITLSATGAYPTPSESFSGNSPGQTFAVGNPFALTEQINIRLGGDTNSLGRQDQFSASAIATAVAVPEPGTMAFGLVISLILVARVVATNPRRKVA
jgi:hypothetical protein